MRNRYRPKNSEWLEKYFSYEKTAKLTREEVLELINIESVLKTEGILEESQIDGTNVYFKLLTEIEHLEKDFENNKKELCHLYYTVGFCVGLFLHPSNGNAVGIHYINKAIELETDEEKIKEYKDSISAINEEP